MLYLGIARRNACSPLLNLPHPRDFEAEPHPEGEPCFIFYFFGDVSCELDRLNGLYCVVGVDVWHDARRGACSSVLR